MFYRKKAIEPIISVILLIVVSVIIVILILSQGTNITIKSLENTKTNELSSSDAEYFIYPKGIIGEETVQFNYSPPNKINEEIIITGYKVLMNNTETETVNLENNYNLKVGQNNLNLDGLTDLELLDNKINILLITIDNKYILLKNIINPDVDYTTESELEQCQIPIFTPDSNTILEDINVTITSNCNYIYYTLDGNNPTIEDNLYSNPITVDENTTIKAISVEENYNDSEIATANYIFEPPIIENINLIINGDAETGDFTGWTTSSQNCSSGWCILGDPGTRAFYSSYPAGMYMSQIIDLTNNITQNYSTEYLDSSPEIEINDYISASWGGRYRIYVELRRADNSVIATFDTGTQTYNSADWLRITNTFSDYGSGLRKIYFVHYGQDTRGWAGNYGTAFDNVSVYVN